MSLLLPAAAGLLAGILSGMGLGGGTLLMLWLTAGAGLDQRTAQGINLLFFLPTAAAALLIHTKNRQVAWRAAVPAAIPGCLTAWGFSRLAMAMDLALLRRLFGGFLLAVGLRELFRTSSGNSSADGFPDSPYGYRRHGHPPG